MISLRLSYRVKTSAAAYWTPVMKVLLESALMHSAFTVQMLKNPVKKPYHVKMDFICSLEIAELNVLSRHTLLFKSYIFLKEVSYNHHGCIYYIKNTVKISI